MRARSVLVRALVALGLVVLSVGTASANTETTAGMTFTGPSTASVCGTNPAAGTITITGVTGSGDALNGFVRVSYVTDGGLQPIQTYTVANQTTDLSLTVSYPPLSSWPHLTTSTPPGTQEVHVDVSIAATDASNTQVALFDGLAGGTNLGYDLFCSGGSQPPPPPPCTAGKVSVRWHYSANGTSGSWSGTASTACPGSVTVGPQAMEGDLKVAPGTLLTAGYDFTLPGNSSAQTVTFTNPQVVFTARCVSGAAPSASTFAVAMPTQTYAVTGSAWYPSGDQHSPLVYQGSVAVPDLCAGGLVRLDKGGTFSAAVG